MLFQCPRLTVVACIVTTAESESPKANPVLAPARILRTVVDLVPDPPIVDIHVHVPVRVPDLLIVTVTVTDMRMVESERKSNFFLHIAHLIANLHIEKRNGREQ